MLQCQQVQRSLSSMVSTQVTESFYLDLETDKVLSEGQMLRHYGCSIDSVPDDLHIFSAFLATTHHSMTYREVRFVTLERKYARLPVSAVRHLAGVAEMRKLLAAPRSEWHSEAGTSFASEQPDAIWKSEQGDVAIEYDAGSYSSKKIRQKIYTFRRFEGQIWGSSSQRRVEHLERFLQEAGETNPPIFAPWT